MLKPGRKIVNLQSNRLNLTVNSKQWRSVYSIAEAKMKIEKSLI